MTVPRGAVLQRDGKTYAVVPRIPAGLVNPDVLERIAAVARKYQIPVLKLTGAARIALVGLKEEDVEAVWAELGMEPAPAVGLCVRSVKACPGTAACRLAQQDSLALGLKMEELFGGMELPGKMKIGVSGCPMNCAETWVKDFGAFGKKKGFTVVVGGSAGVKPRLAELLAEDLAAEEVVGLFEKVVAVYREKAKPGERLGAFLDRFGIEQLKANVL